MYIIYPLYICLTLKLKKMKINTNITDDNPNYLGYDEDCDGDWNEYFMCSNCKENNYITISDKECEMCGEEIEWIN